MEMKIEKMKNNRKRECEGKNEMEEKEPL